MKDRDKERDKLRIHADIDQKDIALDDHDAGQEREPYYQGEQDLGQETVTDSVDGVAMQVAGLIALGIDAAKISHFLPPPISCRMIRQKDRGLPVE